MRILLIGVDGSRKRKLGKALLDLHANFEPKLLGGAASLTETSVPPALGSFTDYRIELELALARAREMREKKHGIFIGSLLDNMAHLYKRIEIANKSGIEDEGVTTRNLLTSSLLYAILVDSLQADILVYLPLGDQTIDSYTAEVDSFYPVIFEYFNLNVLILGEDLEENIKAVNEKIKEASEQRTDNSQPIEAKSE